MAFTEQNKADAYLFFVLAFNAAPGTVYGGQIVQAYESGMTTADIVAEYVTKDAFKAIYPDSQTNAEFAAALVNNVASANNPAAAKTAAIADIEKALADGWTKAQVITQIIGNLANKTVADAEWGQTVAQLNNKIAVAKALTEGDKALSTTDASLLSVAKVTEDLATVDAALNAAGDLASKLDALAAANKAVSDFAAGLDLDEDGEADNLTADNVETEIAGLKTTKAGEVDALVAGWSTAPTTAQKDALVAEAKAANNVQVANQQNAVNTAIAVANAADVTKAQISQYSALVTKVGSTDTAAEEAATALGAEAAKAKVLVGTATSADVPADTATLIVSGNAYFELNAASGALVFKDGVTAENKAILAAYVTAYNAALSTEKAAEDAVKALVDFANQLNTNPIANTDVSVVAGVVTVAHPAGESTKLIQDVVDAQTDLADDQAQNGLIDAALAAYAEAVQYADQLTALTDKIAAAEKAFTDAGLTLPVEVAGAVVATAESDTFIAAEANGSISGFGVLGNDSIYVGSGYVWNATGDLTKGDNAVLEVFFKANGSSTDVYIEQKAFGSNSAGAADTIKIELSGVAADDLTFENGFITVA